MVSEIDVVEEVELRDRESESASTGGGEAVIGGEGFDSLRNDVCTAAGLGDLEKLRRLVECEGCSVFEPDGQGYYALQWPLSPWDRELASASMGGGEAAIWGEGFDSLRNDVYTAAGLGDLEKLRDWWSARVAPCPSPMGKATTPCNGPLSLFALLKLST